jgi:hypothetical protein
MLLSAEQPSQHPNHLTTFDEVIWLAHKVESSIQPMKANFAAILAANPPF